MSRLAAVLVLGQVMSGVAWQTPWAQTPARPEDAAERPPTLEVSAVPLGDREHNCEPEWLRVRVSDPLAATILRHALADASRRLAAPGCQAVLTEFQDQRGRPLADNLSALNLSIVQYLRLIVFVDGDLDERCSTAVAFTAAGSRVVFICPRMLVRTSRENGEHLVVVLIHEVLHTLGLGEDPPSSVEITRTVRRFCREPLS
jgi:hypothetical protein